MVFVGTLFSSAVITALPGLSLLMFIFVNIRTAIITILWPFLAVVPKNQAAAA